VDQAGIDQPLQPPTKALSVRLRSLANEIGKQLSVADESCISHCDNHREIAAGTKMKDAPPQVSATFVFRYEDFFIRNPFHVTSHLPVAVRNSAPGIASSNVS
jgi:hypothetical protein